MKVIQVNSNKLLSTNLYPDFSNVKTIEIEDKPIAEGAFGEVYLCISINNQTLPIPQVIKLFKEDHHNRQDHNFETIQKFQKKLNAKNESVKKNNGKIITEEYPSLKGIPQLSFEGNINGKTIRGFSSSNLKRLGFEEFIDVLDKPNLYLNYQKLSIDKKILIASHLVAGFKILQEMFFIHADLKPEALFVNIQNNECAIIDFDSGTITENARDTPNVWGAPNDWVAPEIWEQLKVLNNGGLQKVKVNLLSDLWSVAVGIHYILTTAHPLFYLNELSPRVTREYFTKYKWPQIDEGELYFNKNNKTIYHPITNWLENTLPKPIYIELSKTVNYGYSNPIQRTTYNEWSKILLSVQNPPTINSFISDRNTIINGIPITLSWDVSDAYVLQIDNNIGFVTNQTNVQVTPSVNTCYKLKAIGHFGETETTLNIKVFPTPLIESLFVPAPIIHEVTNLQINFPKFPKTDISINNFQNGIQLDRQNIHSASSNFNLTSFEEIELIEDKKQTTWENVISPLMSRFSNINKWIFRKNKIS
jgi:serine/threonine protein kinase